MMQINMISLAHLTLLALREMKSRGNGHIVNIGSIAGSLPNQGIAVYSATKSFVESFTTSLHRELVGSGVHISVIKPGPVATPFYDRAAAQEGGSRIPGERFAVHPEAVAQRILALLRRPRRVVYVPHWLHVVSWVEPALGWLIDLFGPLLLRRQARTMG
jgi:short-subunit dehydrogenase